MKDGGRGNHELLAQRYSQAHVHIHAGPELQAGVRDHQANRQGTCHGINLRQQIVDAPGKYFSWVRIDTDVSVISRLDLARIALKDLSEYPNVR